MRKLYFFLYLDAHFRVGQGGGIGKFCPWPIPVRVGKPYTGWGSVGWLRTEWGHFAIPTSFVSVTASVIDNHAPAIEHIHVCVCACACVSTHIIYFFPCSSLVT